MNTENLIRKQYNAEEGMPYAKDGFPADIPILPMTHTDKQPQTVSRWVKVSDKTIPIGYIGVIRNHHPSGIYVFTRWDRDYPGVSSTAEWLEEVENVLLYTPEELEALKLEWQREAVEKALIESDESWNFIVSISDPPAIAEERLK